ncbi:MAG: hypothetical protein Q9182_006493 [Xanthomendoza sp. 2 TL-2023]
MPAPVQTSDHDAALRSEKSEKSNSWSAAQRMDIFNRRQQGEKWDTIIVIMKKQAVFKTPNKVVGKRRKAPSIASPAVPSASKRISKRQMVQEDTHRQSDAESDANSTSYIASQTIEGNDGPTETDEETESPRGPGSDRKKRLSKRLQRTMLEDDEPVSARPRPRRTRASGINYNILQNSGYDQDDQDEAVALDPAAETPVRLSKIIALRMGSARRPVMEEMDPKIKKVRKSLNIDIDGGMPGTSTAQDQEYAGRRMSTRGKKLMNGKSDYLPSPLSFAADGDTNSLGGRRKRGIQEQDQDQDQDSGRALDIGSDSKATRSSRKRKTSEAESIGTRPRKLAALETSPRNEHDHPGRGHTKNRGREHLGFLANGQPRQRRRRRTRAQIELEDKNPATKNRRSNYQFPYLDGYNGPPPPDLATILARQEEQERQNPVPETDSDPESTSSSLMSLDDEDDTVESQPQEPDMDPNEEAISPLTRPTVDEQLSAASTTVAVSPPSGLQTAQSTMSGPLKLTEIIFFAEDIEKGRRNARNMQAAREAEQTMYEDNVQASANALAKAIADNNELTRELKILRKDCDAYRSKAEELPLLKQELATHRERQKSDQKEIKKLTASEIALVEEKQRTAQLADELERSRLETQAMSDDLAKKVAELNQLHSDRASASKPDDDDPSPLSATADSELAQERDRVQHLTDDLRKAKDDYLDLQADLDAQEVETDKLATANAKLTADNTTLHRQLADLTTKHDTLLLTTTAPAPAPALEEPTPAPQTTTLLPLLLTLRQSHIRLAGHIRAVADTHTPLHASLRTVSQKLEEDELPMRDLRRIAKEQVEASEKMGKGLRGAREGSEVVKGGIMGVWDEVGGS